MTWLDLALLIFAGVLGALLVLPLLLAASAAKRDAVGVLPQWGSALKSPPREQQPPHAPELAGQYGEEPARPASVTAAQLRRLTRLSASYGHRPTESPFLRGWAGGLGADVPQYLAAAFTTSALGRPCNQETITALMDDALADAAQLWQSYQRARDYTPRPLTVLAPLREAAESAEAEAIGWASR